MNGAETVSAAKGERIPTSWRVELWQLARLATPIVLTQLAWVSMLTTDTAMIGRLGAEALAGATLSLMIYFIAYVACFGVVIATAALASQAYGARRPRIVRRVIRQGLWITVAITVPSLVAFHFTPEILRALSQPPEVLGYSENYMRTLMWSLPPAIGFAVLRNFIASVNKPMPALWVMLAGVPLNALLDYGLIFGNFGLPRLELIGAGLATTIVNIVIFLALLVIAVRHRPFARYAILGRFWRPDWHQFREILRIGIPIAGIMLLEAGFFIATVFVMGQFGTIALAAHTIAFQLPHITFMVPMGLSQAATVRVGHAVGRRDASGARRAGWAAIVGALTFMGTATIVILLFRETLASIFLDTSRADSAAVLALATTFLLYAAMFQLADGLQAVAAGALRGLHDTTIPMILAAFSYWVVGAGVALGLAFPGNMEGTGLWIGFVVGLLCIAALLTHRFHSLTQNGYLPALVTER
jgi:MATE family multidrug resistance protein